MGQRVIPCDVLNEYITGAGVVVGAAGSHDEVLLELDFRAADSVWAGTTRVVTFRDALSQNPVDVILGVDLLSEGHTDVYLVPIPARAKAIEGEMRMTIRGVIVQGDKELVRVVTKTALFRVLPSELNLYDENTDVPASAAEQLQSQIDGVKGKFVALDEAVKDTKQSAEAADASAKAAANSEQRAGELTQGFDERVTSALEDVEEARQAALNDLDGKVQEAAGHVVDAENAAEGIGAYGKEVEAILFASGWSGSGPYTQTVSISGANEDSFGNVGLPESATKAQRDEARGSNLFVSDVGAGTITVTADGSKPTIDIPVLVQFGKVINGSVGDIPSGGVSIPLDTTLSKSGYAADAKAVGDALAKFKGVPSVTTATVGQTIKVAAVDDAGKPTEWEAVDMYDKTQIDTALGNYITDVAALVGGDA